jgi:MAF protein
MSIAGYQFHVMVADIDETPLPAEPPADYTLRVSRVKAQTIAPMVNAGAIIISCDTTVALGNEILGKPANADEARQMLGRLRGQAHVVLSALTLVDTKTGDIIQELAETELTMRPYTDEEVEGYIQTGDPFDKAGSYAIQHQGFQPVAHWQGCYANVMGLPLCHLTRALRKFGVFPNQDVPSHCQHRNNIVCEVFEGILTQP